MKLSEPIEETGFFWLPEDPKTRLPGVLRISESGEATLQITNLNQDHAVKSITIGKESVSPKKDSKQKNPLSPPFSKHEFGAPFPELHHREFKRVDGMIKKGYVSLEDCYYSSQNYQSSGFTTSTIISRFVFSGVGYDAEEEITFSEIKFSMEGLDEWLGISGIQVDHNLGTERWQEGSIQYEPPEKIILSLPEDMEMIFGFDVSVPSGLSITEARISQKAYIRLKSTRLRPLEDFLPLIFILHRFFCFAIDETISLVSVTGYSSGITIGEKNREIPIKIYFKSPLYSKNKPRIHRHYMLFAYRDVEDKLEELIANWLQNHDSFKEAFNEYFAAKYGAYEYLEGEFLSLVRSIEVLHRKNTQDTEMPEEQFRDMLNVILENTPHDKRKWIEAKLKNELSLQKRIKKMLKPFQQFYGNERKRKSFINKVVTTRNYLTHFDGNLAEDAAKGNDLWALSMKLETLFRLHFLKMIGMDSTFIDNIVEKSRNLRQTLEFSEKDNS